MAYTDHTPAHAPSPPLALTSPRAVMWACACRRCHASEQLGKDRRDTHTHTHTHTYTCIHNTTHTHTHTHRSNAERTGRDIALRLKNVLSRQQFDVAIQACVGSKVVARETIKAVRKNVLVCMCVYVCVLK